MKQTPRLRETERSSLDEAEELNTMSNKIGYWIKKNNELSLSGVYTSERHARFDCGWYCRTRGRPLSNPSRSNGNRNRTVGCKIT